MRAQHPRLRRAATTGRAVLLAAGAAGLLLSGCSTPKAPAEAAGASASAEVSHPVEGPAQTEASVDAHQNAGDAPPAAAQMVCSDEIRGFVGEALTLSDPPAPEAVWADQVYTCTYRLPMGPLVLAVTVAPSDAAAADRLAAMRDELGADTAEQALGAPAYSAAEGRVLAVRDNMVLDVDATQLPDDLGAAHARRIDVARFLTVAVFNCWIGNT